MTNGASPVCGIEEVGTDIVAGYSFPAPGIQQGILFGMLGSRSRSSTGAPAFALYWRLKEELMTIAAAATSTSADTSILPANSEIEVVQGRNTVAIPTATTYQVGSTGQAGRFATGVAVAINTTFVGFLHKNPAVASDALGPRQTANAGVLITPSSTPASAVGTVALQVVAKTYVPPTA